MAPLVRRGGTDTALSVWVVEQQEVTEETLALQSVLFLRHPDIQSDVWATPSVPNWVLRLMCVARPESSKGVARLAHCLAKENRHPLPLSPLRIGIRENFAERREILLVREWVAGAAKV